MTKIVRTPTRAAGGITAEERARMDVIAQKWINIAMRTDPIEPDKIIPAIHDLYAAAGLKQPRVVIVPSPLVMAAAYGAAAAIWHGRGAATDDATRAATRAAAYDATYDATRVATHDATYDATHDATRVATRAATSAATYVATSDATYAATDAATYDATRAAAYAATAAATRAATYAATDAATLAAAYAATAAATDAAASDATSDATYDATRDAEVSPMQTCRAIAGEFGVKCAQNWWRAYQGGNMWAAFPAYAEAMRDVIGLDLPEFKKYDAWERAAMYGGFRVMHPEFCIVCDFPSVLKVDDQNRPHCENGPSHMWRDGWALYHWHGVRVPDEWITDKANLRAADVLKVENVEQRMAGCQILGWARVADQLGRKIIDGDPNTDIGALVELTLPGLPEPGRFLMAQCPRNGTICEGVPRVSDIDGLPINTAIAAQAWRDALPVSEYTHPAYRC